MNEKKKKKEKQVRLRLRPARPSNVNSTQIYGAAHLHSSTIYFTLLKVMCIMDILLLRYILYLMIQARTVASQPRCLCFQ